jgi:tocopherol cyclase
MRQIHHPEYFQGKRQKRRYFEGWYFKCISADRRLAVAIIPGMAIDPHGLRHSFIQVINATSGKTYYFHYPYADFDARADRFAVRISESRFDAMGLTINAASSEGQISGQLRFSNAHPFPTRWYNPGIMGPYTFFPFMECYHAIIHLFHSLQGTIVLDGESMDFTGGTGYIEKDYGHSFPRTYLWLQASHFSSGEASFVFSQARIPFLWTEFPGFFAYFTDFSGVTCRFATYNRSRLLHWQVDAASRTCAGEIEGPAGRLLFSAQMAGGGRLRAPVDGLMDREIIESISAQVQITVKDHQGKILYEGASSEAGMEICM